ncbi:MAG: potassium-transporting ATPase subunit KdpA [Brevinematales bacterium]|jgi:K+-transporting ATPase ATPase A chain
MMSDIIFAIVLFSVLVLLAVLLGKFMSRVFEGTRTFLTPVFSPLEKLIYMLCRIDPSEEMNWVKYAFALVWFNLAGFLLLFIIQLVQGILPFNPQKFGAVRWDTALNTAISFMTNTNWQAYAGESTLSYFTQMVGLTVQNFVSAATGFGVMLALFRGFTRKTTDNIGNFWVDMTRAVLYVLIPLSIVWAVILSSQGVIQTLGGYVNAITLQGHNQVIAVGPVASQEAIKMLGTNGGGFFNVNSAHPFENPNWFTNFMELLAIMLLPASLPFTMGYMFKSRKKGWAMFMAMFILLIVGIVFSVYTENKGNPIFSKAGIIHGVNMEGKETRFGVFTSVLWGVTTTAIANGSVNAMHDSFLPLTAIFPMFNMLIGEVIFGGVGVGIIGMLFYAFMTMFLAGLMIGRTPEIYNKKLEVREMIWTLVGIITGPLCALIFTAAACMLKDGLAGLNNGGPHGFSEMLYAFASAHGNNGSAFAGLNANTPFYNLMTGAAMLIGRFATIIPALIIAGSLAKKKFIPDTAATFQTTTPLYVVMLVSVVVIFGGLTFFVPFVLGPILDHLLMFAGHLY